jgi:hypothetical protein
MNTWVAVQHIGRPNYPGTFTSVIDFDETITENDIIYYMKFLKKKDPSATHAHFIENDPSTTHAHLIEIYDKGWSGYVKLDQNYLDKKKPFGIRNINQNLEGEQAVASEVNDLQDAPKYLRMQVTWSLKSNFSVSVAPASSKLNCFKLKICIILFFLSRQ